MAKNADAVPEAKEKGFNEKDDYKTKVEPLVKEILMACDQCHIPMFMTFATEDTGRDTHYETEVLSSTVENRELKNDLIRKHTLVMDGFDVVPEKKRDAFADMFSGEEE